MNSAIKKTVILLLIIIALSITGIVGYINKNNLMYKTPLNERLPHDKNWLSEGAIYETHPYYYPNHSFKEITAEIPKLSKLGIKTIYLMPIWEHSAKTLDYSFIYLIKDYYKIDPKYGSSEELKTLVNTVHKYDMKIIFDLVTCCTLQDSNIWNNKWVLNVSMSKLQKEGIKFTPINRNGVRYLTYGRDIKKSKFYFKLAGTQDPQNKDNLQLLYSPYVGWGYAVDRTKPEVIKYFTDVASYYVKEYDVDGWRVDSPVDNYDPDIIKEDHSSINLLNSVKTAITSIKPDAVLIAENPFAIRIDATHNNPKPVFDEITEASYSYPFQRQLKDLKTSQQFVDYYLNENILNNATRLRILETHDTKRVNEIAPNIEKPLIVEMATVPGIPMIQTGQAIGATSSWFNDKSNPLVDWNNGDYDLNKFYKKVFNIRNSSSALKYGNIKNVFKSGDDVYAYSRNYKNETVIVVINFNNNPTKSGLNIPFLKDTTLIDELSGEIFTVNNPTNFSIDIPAYGSRILMIKM